MNIHLFKFKHNSSNSHDRWNVRGILTTMLIVVSALIPALAKGEEIFAELAKQKEVGSTYIDGRFSKNKRIWRSNSGERAVNLDQGFSALYTYTCYSQETVKLARKILDNYLSKNKKMELMMSTKEHGSEYLIYEEYNEDTSPLRLLIWNCDGPAACEIVVVDYWPEGCWPEGRKRDNSYIEYNEFSPYMNELIPYINGGINMGLSALGSLQYLDELHQLKSLEGLDQLFNPQTINFEEYE